jgi:hypothetical protein
MRVRVCFDQKLELGFYSKVMISVPAGIEYIEHLIEFLRHSFGVPEVYSGRLWMMSEGYLIPPSQRVADILSDDDELGILVASVPGIAVEEPACVAVPDIEIAPPEIGQSICFRLSPDSKLCTGLVKGIKKCFTTGVDVVVFEDQSTGTWDSLRITEMHGLKVVSEDRERPRKRTKQDETSDWPTKQREKSLSAIRRQIEWYLKSESSIPIDEIMSRQRVLDLTDCVEDVISAISKSEKAKLENGVVVLVV